MIALLPVNIRLAFRSLGRNRMRTLLTMLGVIIGVAAVLTMVALGTGARGAVQRTVKSAGANLVFVQAGNFTRNGETAGLATGLGVARTLVAADAQAIRQSVPGLLGVSPEVTTRTFVYRGGTSQFAVVHGVAADFGDMYDWVFKTGRMFTSAEVSGTGKAAVLGSALADELFGTGVSPLGATIVVSGVTYTVVGVADGTTAKQTRALFVPWTTLQRSLGVSYLDSITVGAQRAGDTSRIAEDIRMLLRKRHGIKLTTRHSYLAELGNVGGMPDDFTVRTQAAQAVTEGLYTTAAAFALANMSNLDEVTLKSMTSTLGHASNTMTALLAAIASVSLVIGGIGIMNIMLVSVRERTREIGLRMATGARGSDVALQFLVEAVTLSVIGGLIGLTLGVLSARIVGWTLGWPATVTATAMCVAVGISAAVGLVFGSYPARRASLLDPIEALRVE
jgi:putative ABC transport system permease protein